MIRYKSPQQDDLLKFLQRLYSSDAKMITFQVTEDCCMACTYCYQHNKTPKKMNFETAKIFIDKLLNDEYDFVNRNNTFAICYDFIGGEPLMEIELISKILDYTITSMIEMQHPWLPYFYSSMCSNGLLYNTPKVQEFFQKFSNWCGYTVSVDGNKELHDKCRIDTQGNPTYDKAIFAIKDYCSKTKKRMITKMTLSTENITYLYDATVNLIQEGYDEVNLNCVFEPGWTEYHATIFYNQLKQVADYIIDNNYYDKFYYSIFEEDMFSPLEEDDDKNWCGGTLKASGGSFAIDYKGDIYPCIRYMDSSLNGRQEPLNFGNIYAGICSTKTEQCHCKLLSNITRRSQSTDKCFYCPIASGCAWCSAYNYEEFGTPNQRATYICIMHQARSLANVYYWNRLYEKLNIKKKFIMHIPREWALNIIDEQEYHNLLRISKEE